MKSIYDEEFYRKNYYDGTKVMSRVVVKEIMKLINPKSVIDFGCGIGLWLDEFKKQGVNKVLGIDFNDADSMNVLEENEYLEKDLTKEIELNEKYDVAMSLEVAEHIDEKYSNIFIDSITNSSDRVIFGCAIPKQGGRNHINEQYPQYWIERFEKKGFVCLDAIRPKLILKEDSGLSARQNILLFIKIEKLEKEYEKYLPFYDKGKVLIHRTILIQSYNKLVRGLCRISDVWLKGLFNSVFDVIILKKFSGDLFELNYKDIENE